MGDPSSRSKLRFTIRALLFPALCIAGFLAGYRIGYGRGYTSGVQKRLSEEPVVVVYDVADVVSFMVEDEVSGGWRPARVDERTPAIADFESLIETIVNSVYPETWQDVGGPGSIRRWLRFVLHATGRITSCFSECWFAAPSW